MLKRKLFNIPKYEYDSSGNIMYDEQGFPLLQPDEHGLPSFVNDDDVVSTLSNNLHGLRKLSDMKTRLEELKEDIPWVNEVVRMLDKNSDAYNKAAADVFFKTFRKSQTLYTNVYKKTEYVNGKRKNIYVIQPTNLGNRSKKMYNRAIKNILDGQFDTIFKKSGKSIFDVVVDEDNLYYLEQYIEDLNNAIKGYDNNGRFDKKAARTAILDICQLLGFDIEENSQLGKYLIKKGRSKDKISAESFYQVVRQFYSKVKGLSGKDIQLNDKRITETYNQLSRMLGVLSDQVVEKTTKDSGKTYQTYTESSPL